MSITNWFVNKYIRTKKEIPVVSDVILISIKYVIHPEYQTESKLYINNNFTLRHGPENCTNSVKDYLETVHNIFLGVSQRNQIAEMFRYKMSGRLKLVNNCVMEIKTI